MTTTKTEAPVEAPAKSPVKRKPTPRTPVVEQAPPTPGPVTAARSLWGVLAAVQAVGKNQRSEDDTYNFRSLDDVLDAVHPALVKVGGFYIGKDVGQSLEALNTPDGEVLTTVRLRVQYSWHGLDGGKPIRTIVSAEGSSSTGGATAAAWSIALRTYLVQTLCLQTNSPDPDQSTQKASATAKPKAALKKIDDVPGVAAAAPEVEVNWPNLAAACTTVEALTKVHAQAEKASQLGAVLDFNGTTVLEMLTAVRRVLVQKTTEANQPAPTLSPANG
ncbi:ERF family protein [Cryobacterium psychrophilum]|uniref:Uncharacterized protein n=1 Tax=Cryobacterium psychrophilum TaxID=41988 RepID=A0A4Y8KWF9_9MICO|nr:ERF family protein [Cryobacterium psychrophilum]TDW30989.1 ERF superfamily protein [Cryobacterium psychrophilum]TFD80851.1 hypothetical protein E3T53_04300 [Cryobacterium psychrophilum]